MLTSRSVKVVFGAAALSGRHNYYRTEGHHNKCFGKSLGRHLASGLWLCYGAEMVVIAWSRSRITSRLRHTTVGETDGVGEERVKPFGDNFRHDHPRFRS